MTTSTATKKTTLATIKAFMKREHNYQNLYVKSKSSFDGMTDCVQTVADEFRLVKAIDWTERNSLGIKGVYFVNSSRDYFAPFADDNFIGYEVYNCCGTFIIAMARPRN